VTAVCLLVVCAAPARASRPPECWKLRPRGELRCARAQLAWAKRGGPHHSAGYWRWRERVARKWIRAARYRISHPPIPHLRLWLCIHALEGAWTDDTGNGYAGGLQMTIPWGRGVYYVWRADLLSPYEQMRKAELGYRASGYSLAWLEGQWWHPSCFQYA
jgi:hypothetical protein